MTVWFEDDKRELQKLDIPYHPNERTFEQFCDFRTAEAEYVEMTKKGNKSDIVDVMNKVVEMLSHLVDGDLLKVPFRHGNESVAKLFEQSFVLTPVGKNEAETGISVLRIYAHITSVFNRYSPKSIPDYFEIHKDELTFVCKPADAAKKMVGLAYSTGQVIEVMEYQRRFTKTMKEKGLEIGVGNMDFSLGMSEIALLCPMEGEQIPSDRNELDNWLTERRELLRSVSLDIIFDLRFFLLNGLLTLKKIQTMNSSSRANRRRRRKKRKPPAIRKK